MLFLYLCNKLKKSKMFHFEVVNSPVSLSLKDQSYYNLTVCASFIYHNVMAEEMIPIGDGKKSTGTLLYLSHFIHNL